jgi:hypothetical protein
MKRVNLKIIALAQIKLTKELEDCEIMVSGYVIARHDAENKNTSYIIGKK